jgi:hypothetical protein
LRTPVQAHRRGCDARGVCGIIGRSARSVGQRLRMNVHVGEGPHPMSFGGDELRTQKQLILRTMLSRSRGGTKCPTRYCAHVRRRPSSIGDAGSLTKPISRLYEFAHSSHFTWDSDAWGTRPGALLRAPCFSVNGGMGGRPEITQYGLAAPLKHTRSFVVSWRR